MKALKTTIAALALLAGAAGQPALADSMFDQGLQDRTTLEQWFNSLQGDDKTGAFYWTSQRSIPHPGSCQQMNADFYRGCTDAKVKFAPTDALRKTEPAYKAGWNSYAATVGPIAAPPPPKEAAIEMAAKGKALAEKAETACPLWFNGRYATAQECDDWYKQAAAAGAARPGAAAAAQARPSTSTSAWPPKAGPGTTVIPRSPGDRPEAGAMASHPAPEARTREEGIQLHRFLTEDCRFEETAQGENQCKLLQVRLYDLTGAVAFDMKAFGEQRSVSQVSGMSTASFCGTALLSLMPKAECLAAVKDTISYAKQNFDEILHERDIRIFGRP